MNREVYYVARILTVMIVDGRVIFCSPAVLKSM